MVNDICRIHDNMFDKAKNQENTQKADEEMLRRLKKYKSKEVGEKIDVKLLQGIIGTKYHLRLGINQKQIIKDLFL